MYAARATDYSHSVNRNLFAGGGQRGRFGKLSVLAQQKKRPKVGASAGLLRLCSVQAVTLRCIKKAPRSERGATNSFDFFIEHHNQHSG